MSLLLIATKKKKLPSWDAAHAGFWGKLIFLFDVPLLKQGITAPVSTSLSYCTVTNFSCPCVTRSAGKLSGAWNTLLALSNKVAGKQD